MVGYGDAEIRAPDMVDQNVMLKHTKKRVQQKNARQTDDVKRQSRQGVEVYDSFYIMCVLDTVGEGSSTPYLPKLKKQSRR